MRRIVVKGGSGSGKSTLAAALARRLGVPHVELDALHHGPNWAAPTVDEFRARVAAAIEDDRGWVVDGNYDAKLGTLVLERAELIVWLDLPLPLKLLRLTQRCAKRLVLRQELWNGNRETLRGLFWGADALFPWAVSSHFMYRRQWPELLEGRPVVTLRTAREVDKWLSAQRS